MIEYQLKAQIPDTLAEASITELADLFEQSASRHTKLCPRQVLGVRMGLFGLRLLGKDRCSIQKQVYVIIEINGCFADGIEVATGCSLGGRTLHVENLGKVAATFIDLTFDLAFRVSVQEGVRWRAFDYVDHRLEKYDAQLEGYKCMPDDELFNVQRVKIKYPVKALLGEAKKRVVCVSCGEEVMNGKEVLSEGRTLCKSCSGQSYYDTL